MKDEIPLDEAQVSAITEIFERMKAKAIQRGERLMALERELESHFRNGTITDAVLRSSLDAIAETRMELRYVHLATHLKTPEILSQDQIKKYNELRGYSDPDPCANIPEGHDAKMWRKHNSCD
jgi:predicted ATPase